MRLLPTLAATVALVVMGTGPAMATVPSGPSTDGVPVAGSSAVTTTSAPLRVVHHSVVPQPVVSMTSSPNGSVYAGTAYGVVEVSSRTGAVVRRVAKVGQFGAQDVALDDSTGLVFATGISDNRLYRVDPETGHVRRSAPQGTLLGQVAVDASRHRVVATLSTGVVAFDTRTMAVQWSVAVDAYPSDIAVDASDGTTMLATRDSLVVTVDGSGIVADDIPLPNTALTLAVDPGRDTLYVGTYGGVDVIRHRLYARTVRVRGDVSDLTVDRRSGRAYAVSALEGVIGHGYVSVVDDRQPHRLAMLRLAGGAAVVGRSATRTLVGAYPSWHTSPTVYSLAG